MILGVLVTLTTVLFTKPILNLRLYQNLKIYRAVEQIPGVGSTLQFALKLTILLH